MTSIERNEGAVGEKPSFMDLYGKTVITVLYALAMVIVPQVTGDGVWDRDEMIVFAMAVGNAVIVWYVPLNNSYKWVKTVVNFFMAVLTAVQLVLIDGSISGDDWLYVTGAGLAVIGVTYVSAGSIKQNQPVITGTGFTTG